MVIFEIKVKIEIPNSSQVGNEPILSIKFIVRKGFTLEKFKLTRFKLTS